MFLECPKNFKSYIFDEVRRTNDSLIFDEWGFGNLLQTIPSIRVMDRYKESFEIICDVLTPNVNLNNKMCRRFYDDEFYLKYSEGKLYMIGLSDDKWYSREFAMCHLQKRAMSIKTNNATNYIIHKDGFYDVDEENQIRNELISISTMIFESKVISIKSIKNRISELVAQFKKHPSSTYYRCLRIIKDYVLK